MARDTNQPPPASTFAELMKQKPATLTPRVPNEAFDQIIANASATPPTDGSEGNNFEDPMAHARNVYAMLMNERDPRVIEGYLRELNGIRVLPKDRDSLANLRREARQRYELAESEYEQQVASASVGAAARTVVEQEVFRQMTNPERNFFNRIDPDQQYPVSNVNANGEINGQPTMVSGQQLREDFATVKLHTLPEEEQRRIVAVELHEDPNSPRVDAAQKKKIDKLHTALDHLEGHHAHEVTTKEKTHPDVAKVKVKKEHAAFARAHAVVDEIKTHMENIEHTTGETQAKHIEDLKKAKEKLAKTLQEEIIENILTGGGGQQASRNLPPEDIGQLSPNGSGSDGRGNSRFT